LIRIKGKFIRRLIPQNGKGHKIILKPLAKTQSLEAMIGYITKDQGQPHYQIKTFNISSQVKNI
jgi:hypothetical protein